MSFTSPRRLDTSRGRVVERGTKESKDPDIPQGSCCVVSCMDTNEHETDLGGVVIRTAGQKVPAGVPLDSVHLIQVPFIMQSTSHHITS